MSVEVGRGVSGGPTKTGSVRRRMSPWRRERQRMDRKVHRGKRSGSMKLKFQCEGLVRVYMGEGMVTKNTRKGQNKKRTHG